MAIRDVFGSLFRAPQIAQAVEIQYGDWVKSNVLGMDVEDLWRTQPYLRIVVSFLARNIAQLGVHSFVRVSESDRQRLRDDPLPKLLSTPNSRMTAYDLVFSIVGDLGLYDESFTMLLADSSSPSGWALQPISPSWIVRRGGGSVFGPEWIDVQAPGTAVPTRVDLADVMWMKGWNPGSPSRASSPVEALKQILAEQMHAQVFREQLWQRGGRIGGYLTRPAGAKWDPTVREKFQTQWQARYGGDNAPKAGGTPILEDGMEYKRAGFSAHEEEYIEGSKLALATVAAVYHVNPTMIGLLDNANFSNVREFRRMLYGDTLGSTIAMIEDRLNSWLVPRVSKTSGAYVEFNIAEKLQGSFEEQAAVISASTGAPWMLRSEARTRFNLPEIPGADELVVPLNVLVGGQASPRDSGSQNQRSGAVRVKSAGRSVKSTDQDTDEYVKAAEQVLGRFFKRQRSVVMGKLGAKAADSDWWDGDRWDRELSDDLYKLAVTTATQLGREQAEALGFEPGDYDEDRTLAFLRSVADSRAGAVNSTTRDRIIKALEANEDPGDVFDEAENARTMSGATALVASLAGFALVEAGKQLIARDGTKTWNTGPNPRPDHAAMDGETVSLEDTFSNGAKWPGDQTLGAEGVSNCNCGVTIEY